MRLFCFFSCCITGRHLPKPDCPVFVLWRLRFDVACAGSGYWRPCWHACSEDFPAPCRCSGIEEFSSFYKVRPGLASITDDISTALAASDGGDSTSAALSRYVTRYNNVRVVIFRYSNACSRRFLPWAFMSTCVSETVLVAYRSCSTFWPLVLILPTAQLPPDAGPMRDEIMTAQPLACTGRLCLCRVLAASIACWQQ